VRTRAAAEGFRALAEAFTQKLRVSHLGDSKERRAGHVLAELLSHLRERGVLRPHDVRHEHLMSFAYRLKTRTTRAGTPLSAASRSAYLSLVRGFFAWLEQRRVLLQSPGRDLPLPRARALPRPGLSEAEVRRLIASSSPFTRVGRRDRAILETLYGTAIRLGECRRLDVTDFDHKALLVRSGKGRKDRVVPIVGRAARALRDYLRESRPLLITDNRDPALFLSLLGRRFSAVGLQRLVREKGRAAGISLPVSPHLLRHACATHLLRGGADVRHVQELLGHRRIETTERYTRLTIKDLQQVIERTHPRR
jgi:integrase/recombinase XerD